MFNGAKFSGTITLMEDASVSTNGDIANGNTGLVGRITGPGGLTIGSPTANSNNGAGGIFLIGAVSVPATANDYAGDTTISGSVAGATRFSMLRIGQQHHAARQRG